MEQINKVTLRRLPITTLNTAYARQVGEQKMRHYSVSPLELANAGRSALDIIQEHIIAEEGPTEFEVINPTPSLSPQGLQTTPMPQVLEGTTIDLGKHVPSQIMQENELIFSPNRLQLLLGYITRPINVLIQAANLILTAMQKPFLKKDLVDFYPHDDFRGLNEQPRVWDYDYSKLKTIPYLPEFRKRYQRFAHACYYLSVSYEEGHESVAAEYLRKDLQALPAGSIKGHLIPPTTIILADTVGNGKLKGALFAFIHIDVRVIAKAMGIINPDEAMFASRDGNKLLTNYGLKTLALEGDLGPALPGTTGAVFEIEEVQITKSTYKAMDDYAAQFTDVYAALALRREEKRKKLSN